MGKVLLWVVGIVVGGFLLMLVIGASVSPEKAAQYQHEAAVEDFCKKAMEDAAPGSEKRTTRAMCEEMNRQMKERYKH